MFTAPDEDPVDYRLDELKKTAAASEPKDEQQEKTAEGGNDEDRKIEKEDDEEEEGEGDDDDVVFLPSVVKSMTSPDLPSMKKSPSMDLPKGWRDDHGKPAGLRG